MNQYVFRVQKNMNKKFSQSINQYVRSPRKSCVITLLSASRVKIYFCRPKTLPDQITSVWRLEFPEQLLLGVRWLQDRRQAVLATGTQERAHHLLAAGQVDEEPEGLQAQGWMRCPYGSGQEARQQRRKQVVPVRQDRHVGQTFQHGQLQVQVILPRQVRGSFINIPLQIRHGSFNQLS